MNGVVGPCNYRHPEVTERRNESVERQMIVEPFSGPGGFTERHYAPSEVAERWNLNVETIRRIFQDEPGVLVFQSPVRKGRRSYKTIRIPESVLDRVHKRLQIG